MSVGLYWVKSDKKIGQNYAQDRAELKKRTSMSISLNWVKIW